jgi:hypothetical protein
MASIADPADALALRRASLIYAQPIALSCGRVLRARTAQETVDACLRAGEILARYIAAVALSSYAARDDVGTQKLIPFKGNLAFGDFLTCIQQIAAIPIAHPATSYISAGFRARKNGSAAPTNAALIALLNVRNDLGHDLNALDAAKARAILAKQDPPKILSDALRGVDGLLNLPLFIVEEQQFAKRIFRARRILMMGESNDPAPEEVDLSIGVDELNDPYVAVSQKILKLPPTLIWDLIEERANYQLLFVDSVDGEKTKYRTVSADKKSGPTGAADELRLLCAGDKRPAEEVILTDGRHLAREWTERRKLIEEAAQRGEGLIPWELLEPATMEWLAARLDKDGGGADPIEVIQRHLLDGRTSINGHERRQIALLLGKPEAVGTELRRELMTLQVNKDPSVRWDERLVIGNANLLDALKLAVDFLSRNLDESGLTFDGLADATGPADYVAIREALINLIIHQEYSDPSAPAQIVIRPEETMLFNVGYSLVEPEKLAEGGRSQSRNPLIARALRLIGFADLGGSGIRVLERAWKQARRRPPRFENNRDANSFTLTLDWRPLPDLHDEFWHDRIGVKLNELQARSLDLIRLAPRTSQELCDALQIEPQDVESILDHLERQVLIQKDGSTFDLMGHMREILG